MIKTEAKELYFTKNTIIGKLLNNNTVYYYFFIMLALSIFANSFALYTEYVWGYFPCNLCLYARLPYFALTIFSIAALICRSNSENLTILYCILICIIASLYISIMHIGIEMEWWSSSSLCSNSINFNKDLSLENLKKLIDIAAMGNCLVVNFSILGFSMSQLNFFVNILLLFLTIIIILYERNINKSTERRHI